MEAEYPDVANVERKLYELEIPGFPMYTIDDEMVLRSYKSPGSPRLIALKANHHGGYDYGMWKYNEDGVNTKYSFSPLRLYLCACAGLNPITTTLEDFDCKDGYTSISVFLRTNNEVRHKPGNVITSYAYRTQMSDKERQQTRAARQELELKALQKALETDDFGEVMEMLWSYKKLVTSVLWVKHHVRKERADELFSIAVEHITQRFRKDTIVTSNFMGALIKNAQVAMVNKA